MRRIRKIGLAAAAGVMALIASAPIASANSVNYGPSWIGSNSGGANVRSCAHMNCGSYGYLGNGTGVTMLCWTDNQWVYPPYSDYGSNRWFKIATPVGVGFTHSSLVENQTSVGVC
ncbi:MAG TPA: hypothetical protein VGD67_00555 [Pseudonocardiaceae bacterium]